MAIRDLSALGKEQERLAGKFFDNLVQFPEGKGVVVVRLLSDENLPLTEGGLFARSRIHYVNGKSLHCPRELVETKNGQFYKGPCPICEYYDKLWKDSKRPGVDPEEAEEMQTKARAIRPVERYYYNCIVRTVTNKETGEVEKNVGPKILPVGKTIHGEILDGIKGSKDDPSDKGFGDVTDPTTGRDFKIIKGLKGTGKDAYPDYKTKFEEPSPLGTPEEVAGWMTKLHDLKALRQVKTYDELLHQMRVHFGAEKDDDIGFDTSDMEGKAKTDTPKPTAKVEVEDVVTEPAPAPVTSDGSETLADDEFLKELQGM